MTAETHPEVLTLELVIEKYERLMRHRIRQFQVSEPADDCLQQILLAMIVPSETLGTSYLERYNPSRGPAQHYVLMFCMQQMMKLHTREKLRRGLMDPIPLVIDDIDTSQWSNDEEVSESLVPDPSWDDREMETTIRRPEDLHRLLAGTRHQLAHSTNSAGEPRSTQYMLELLIWGGFSIAEIALRLEVTSAEVRRRFKALSQEPRLRAFLNTASAA